MSKILKEAIADAKIVRATAIANAKAILNEAFEPKLKKLINTKLKEELEDEKPEDTLEVTEDDELSADVPVNKEVEPEVTEGEEEDITGATAGEDEVKEGEDTEIAPEDEIAPEVAEDEVPSEVETDELEPKITETDDQDQDDKEFNIDEVIKELEDESGIEPSVDDEVTEDEELSTDVPGNKKVQPVSEDEECEDKPEVTEGDDEEVEIVDDKPEVTEDEVAPGEDDSEKEVYERIIMRQRSAIREQKKVISTYKNQLHEINLLNAKLLYTNKLFNTFPLSNGEKMRVVESFDRTCTVREAKLVFASLHQAFASKTLTESKMRKIKSSASKTVASTKPSKETVKKLNESADSQATNEMRDKFRRLANIEILKD
jgi:hypothetical protein